MMKKLIALLMALMMISCAALASAETYYYATNPEYPPFESVEADGSVVGYAGLLVVLDEGYITNVAVRPESRRAGVASALLDVFVSFAEGNRLAFLTLEVRASNYGAIALYGSRGFRGVGRRPNYYEHPKEDAIIMTREFDYAGTEAADPGAAQNDL